MNFEEIYTTYWPRILRLCLGFTNDQEFAKDLAQETFIIVWKQLPKFRGESNIGTWIFRIASNHCLRQVEKLNRIQRNALPSHLSDDNPTSIDLKIELLHSYIAELSESDRIIISLELEDVKQSDIATIMGLSESAIRVRIHRIKEKLTKRFKENEH